MTYLYCKWLRLSCFLRVHIHWCELVFLDLTVLGFALSGDDDTVMLGKIDFLAVILNIAIF